MRHSITAWMALRNQDRPMLRESAELFWGPADDCITTQFLGPMSTKSSAIARKRRSVNVYDRLCCVS